jgi:hypothetical protein
MLHHHLNSRYKDHGIYPQEMESTASDTKPAN